MLSSSDHSHTPDLVNYYVTYCTATQNRLDCIFVVSDHSHTYLVNYYANYCTAQNRSGLHFCTFIIVRPLSHTRLVNYYATYCIALLKKNRYGLHVLALFIIFRPLSHTRSSKLLCNLLHCFCSEYLWTALFCTFIMSRPLSPLYLCSTHTISVMHYHRCAADQSSWAITVRTVWTMVV